MGGDHGLPYAVDITQAKEVAFDLQTPLFLDFTGINCVNCRKMEKSVLPKGENPNLLSQLVRVQLYTDTNAIPGTLNWEDGKRIRAINKQLQEEWLKDVTLPSYVVVTPDGKEILSRFSGYKEDPVAFADFLKKGINEWQTRQAKTNTGTRMN